MAYSEFFCVFFFFTPLTPVVARRNLFERVCDKPDFSSYYLLIATHGTKSLSNDGELTRLMTNFVTCAMPQCRTAPPVTRVQAAQGWSSTHRLAGPTLSSLPSLLTEMVARVLVVTRIVLRYGPS